MRKALAVALAVGLLAGAYAVPAEAAKKKKKPVKVERVVEFEYTCPCGVKVLGNGPAFQLGSTTGGDPNVGGGVVTFDPTTEKFLKIESEDALGMPLAIRIAMDTDPNDTSVNNTVADVCGTTDEPLELPDVEAEFRVFVTSGTCADGTPQVASEGMITFTLSNLP
jgi:hypothetical protein